MARLVFVEFLARPKRFELLTPRFVVWAGPLKSLRSVTVRKPLLVEIPCISAIFESHSVTVKLSVFLPITGPETDVERSIGNGEVDSSILSGSTIRLIKRTLYFQDNSAILRCLRDWHSIDQIRHFDRNRQ
jgi:hypothetical protein